MPDQGEYGHAIRTDHLLLLVILDALYRRTCLNVKMKILWGKFNKLIEEYVRQYSEIFIKMPSCPEELRVIKVLKT